MQRYISPALLFFLFSLSLAGQNTRFRNLDSFEKAVSVVKRSIEAMDMADGLRLKTLKFDFEGEIYCDIKVTDRIRLYESTPLKAKLVYDLANTRIAYEANSEAPGGFRNHRRDVREKKGGFTADFYRKRVQELPDASVEDLRYVLDRVHYKTE